MNREPDEYDFIGEILKMQVNENPSVLVG